MSAIHLDYEQLEVDWFESKHSLHQQFLLFPGQLSLCLPLYTPVVWLTFSAEADVDQSQKSESHQWWFFLQVLQVGTRPILGSFSRRRCARQCRSMERNVTVLTHQQKIWNVPYVQELILGLEKVVPLCKTRCFFASYLQKCITKVTVSYASVIIIFVLTNILGLDLPGDLW